MEKTTTEKNQLLQQNRTLIGHYNNILKENSMLRKKLQEHLGITDADNELCQKAPYICVENNSELVLCNYRTFTRTETWKIFRKPSRKRIKGGEKEEEF